MFVSRKVSASTQEKSSQEQAQQAQMAFKLYDRDKDGYITKAEMIKISKTLTKDQVEKVRNYNKVGKPLVAKSFRRIFKSYNINLKHLYSPVQLCQANFVTLVLV